MMEKIYYTVIYYTVTIELKIADPMAMNNK